MANGLQLKLAFGFRTLSWLKEKLKGHFCFGQSFTKCIMAAKWI